jgi:type II secretory pathway component PulF
MIDYARPEHRETFRRRGSRLVLRWLARMGLTIVGLAVVGGPALLLGRFGGGAWLGYLGLIGGLMLLGGSAAAMTYARRQRGQVVLAHLGQATSLSLPLPAMLRAAAESEPRGTARRLRRVATQLEDGHPLAVALQKTMPELPARVVSLVGAGEANGTLPQTIESVLDRRAEELRRQNTSFAGIGGAIGSVLFLAASAIQVLMVFVVPKFEMIFRDFGVPLPPSMRALVRASQPLGDVGLMLMVVLFGAWLIWVAGRQAWMLVYDPPHRTRGWGGRMWSRLRWRLPVLGAIDRDRGTADALAVIADAVQAERPLPAAIREGALPHLSEVLMARLNRWADAVEQGTAADRAARDAKLPAVLADLLVTARGPDDVVGALRLVSARSVDRWARRMAFVRAAGIMGLTLLMGLIVGWVAVALFSSMQVLFDVSMPAAYKVL